MSEVSEILVAIEQGDPQASNRLFPLVYDELRKLAARKLARERPGQTLQATALANEAYIRLVGGEPDRQWDGRGHFFAAAAEAIATFSSIVPGESHDKSVAAISVELTCPTWSPPIRQRSFSPWTEP